jgi:hypothetical protein
MLNIITEEFKKKESNSTRVNYDIDGKQLLPEQIALEYYKSKGYKGLWTENDYWWTLFALLFWDIIFAKVRGAVTVGRGGEEQELDPNYDEEYERIFNTSVLELNGMPSDMFHPEFASNRSDLIKNRYKELKNKDVLTELEKKYQENKNKNCRLIENWEKFSLEKLKEPLTYLNKEVLLRIILRLAIDFNENRPGLPDLLVYKEDDFRFIEVKSEKDNLSQAQVKWINFLALDLDSNFDIFLINHPEKKIEKIKEKFTILLNPIKIQLGSTSSSKREEIIELFKKQKDYNDEKNKISASFWIYDKNIKEIIKTVGLWKTTRFFVQEKEYTVEQIRNVVYESYDRKRFDIDYYDFWLDRGTNYDCSKVTINYINETNWKGFGYIDTTEEKWVFDLPKITKAVEENLEENVLCPYFDREKFKKDFLKLPETINPKENSDWAFVDKDNCEWVYKDNKWVTRYDIKEFPGITSITGIKKLSIKEKYELLGHSKRKQSETDTSQNPPQKPQKEKNKSNSKIIIIVISVLLFLFLCCACNLVLS